MQGVQRPGKPGNVREFLENSESQGEERELSQNIELQTQYFKFLIAF